MTLEGCGLKRLVFKHFFSNVILKDKKQLLPSTDASQRAKDLFLSLNCSSNLTNTDLLTCAQEATSDKVLYQVYNYMSTLPYMQNLNMWSWGTPNQIFNNPTVDYIMFNNTMDKIIQSGQVKNCKIITGFNSEEYFLFTLDSIANSSNLYGYFGFHFKQFLAQINRQFYFYPSYPYKAPVNFAKQLVDAYFKSSKMPLNLVYPIYMNYFIQIMSDFWFVCQSFDIAEIYSSFNSDAYAYEFKYRGSNTYIPKYLGTATHGDELFYVFGGPLLNAVKKNFEYFF
jgi:carboxylesterase type B